MDETRKRCTFSTSCWEKDWRLILLDPNYLRKKQISNHCYSFFERILVINNVTDLSLVKNAAEKKIQEGVLTRYVVVDEIVDEMLSFFQLRREDFRLSLNAKEYGCANPDWVYYNALGPLAAIYSCRSEYLLFLTGDVRLDHPLPWISPSIQWMEKQENIKVANPVWNEKYEEAKNESYKRSGLGLGCFYFAKQGFSDQLFLVRRKDFRQPIYGEIRSDSAHYPRGDVFEKRVFSYMKNRGWERIIYRRGSYTHENVV